ncbi:MAG TPA: cytochrome c peroxidase [Steroidobacteraceae bacterium]|nr:cytochrome c peroxidase [Steroidobacteraceae bacterium]
MTRRLANSQRRRAFAMVSAVLACISVDPIPSFAGSQGTAASQSFYANTFEKRPGFAAMTALGRRLFFDPVLSASGTMSCATCHDPGHALGPPNSLPVQSGGISGKETGLRAVPSLRYAQNVPAFTEHFFEDDGNDSEDQGPAGGRTWDGRAQSAHDQARLPLLSRLEMANTDVASMISRLRSAACADQFRDTYGQHVLDDTDRALKALLLALEVYQQSPPEFYPYDSKYDAWLRRQVDLSPREQRGLNLFNDPRKGNCASCHPSGIKDGAFPQFTDFGYTALGVPRNRTIAANADAAFYDLGLCGPLRSDLRDNPGMCGRFRTPSLRNVATRRVFFHNGAVSRLEDAVRFYATRDTQPESWYPRAPDGTIRKFDDLPAPYQVNIEMKPPFGQHAGEPRLLSEEDVADIVAFLNTLTDGYSR